MLEKIKAFWPSLWPILLHRFFLIVLPLIAAKWSFAKEVSEKLMTGDTVEMWAGAPTFTLAEIERYLVVAIPTVVISAAVAFWGRIRMLFSLIRARMSPKELTAGQVEGIVQGTPKMDIIQTVAAKP